MEDVESQVYPWEIDELLVEEEMQTNLAGGDWYNGDIETKNKSV